MLIDDFVKQYNVITGIYLTLNSPKLYLSNGIEIKDIKSLNSLNTDEIRLYVRNISSNYLSNHNSYLNNNNNYNLLRSSHSDVHLHKYTNNINIENHKNINPYTLWKITPDNYEYIQQPHICDIPIINAQNDNVLYNMEEYYQQSCNDIFLNGNPSQSIYNSNYMLFPTVNDTNPQNNTLESYENDYSSKSDDLAIPHLDLQDYFSDQIRSESNSGFNSEFNSNNGSIQIANFSSPYDVSQDGQSRDEDTKNKNKKNKKNKKVPIGGTPASPTTSPKKNKPTPINNTLTDKNDMPPLPPKTKETNTLAGLLKPAKKKSKKSKKNKDSNSNTAKTSPVVSQKNSEILKQAIINEIKHVDIDSDVLSNDCSVTSSNTNKKKNKKKNKNPLPQVIQDKISPINKDEIITEISNQPVVEQPNKFHIIVEKMLCDERNSCINPHIYDCVWQEMSFTYGKSMRTILETIKMLSPFNCECYYRLAKHCLKYIFYYLDVNQYVSLKNILEWQ